jgi:hypothetical protein
MKPPNDIQGDPDVHTSEEAESSHQPIRLEDVLKDLRAGLRTRGFLTKYGLEMGEFEQLLKSLIRRRLFTVEEYREWKVKRAKPAPDEESRTEGTGTLTESEIQASLEKPPQEKVLTYIISEPEKNNSWALELFSTQRDQVRGARFKVNLQGRRYAFVVQEMLFRGQVEMLDSEDLSATELKARRERAMAFIAEHGWAAYLENRAIIANVDHSSPGAVRKARLVVLHCRNDTYVAALHTPAPAINLYVGSSLEKLKARLAKSVDIRILNGDPPAPDFGSLE